MPKWFIPVFIALAALSFIMVAPTFLINSITRRFQLHPRLTPGAVIRINDTALSNELKEVFVQSWNQAKFLYPYDSRLPRPAKSEYVVVIEQKRRQFQFSLAPDDEHIDIVRNDLKKKGRAYRVYAPELSQLVLADQAEGRRLS